MESWENILGICKTAHSSKRTHQFHTNLFFILNSTRPFKTLPWMSHCSSCYTEVPWSLFIPSRYIGIFCCFQQTLCTCISNLLKTSTSIFEYWLVLSPCWYCLLCTVPQPNTAETLLLLYFFIPTGKSADQDKVQGSHSFLTYAQVLTWQTLAQTHLVEDR